MAGEIADIPLLGCGTFDEDIAGDRFVAGLTHALKTGYRHIDTAEMYTNTAGLIAQALEQSGVERASVWVTSKLSGLPCGPFEAVEQRARAHLAALRLDYVDLLLIHWPGHADAEQPASLAWFKEQLASAWENMTRLKQLGLARRIGVSNFYAQHVEALLALPGADKPYANQIFIDVAHQRREFVASLQQQGIVVIAYRPLAYLGVFTMFDEGQQIADAAQAAGAADSQQLVLATLIRRGVVAIPRSSSPEHLDSNFQAVQLAHQVEPSLLDAYDQHEDVIACGGDDEFAQKWEAQE